MRLKPKGWISECFRWTSMIIRCNTLEHKFPERQGPFFFPSLALNKRWCQISNRAKQTILKFQAILLPRLKTLLSLQNACRFSAGKQNVYIHQWQNHSNTCLPFQGYQSKALPYLVLLTRLTACPSTQNYRDEVTETALCFLFQGTWSDVWFRGRRQKYHN